MADSDYREEQVSVNAAKPQELLGRSFGFLPHVCGLAATDGLVGLLLLRRTRCGLRLASDGHLCVLGSVIDASGLHRRVVAPARWIGKWLGE